MRVDKRLFRRHFLALLLGMGAIMFCASPALSKDGGGDGGGSNSGSGGGPESGDDNGDDGDDGDKSDSDSDDDGDGSNSGKGNGRIDSEKIRDAIASGKAISLSKAISFLRKTNDDRVIDVRLISNGSNYDYRFKVISQAGNVKTIKMDAKTGRIRNFLGL